MSYNFFEFYNFWSSQDFARNNIFYVVTSGPVAMSPFFFKEVNIPGFSEHDTESKKTSTLNYEYPVAYYPDNLELTVYTDVNYSSFKKFHNWRKQIYSDDGKLSYYDEYVQDFTIYALSHHDHSSVVLTCTLQGVYPKSISEIRLQQEASGEILTFTSSLFVSKCLIS